MGYMKELVVIRVGGNPYGVWKDAFLSIREIGHIYGLPFTPERVSGVCLIDHRTALLYNLGVCLGDKAFGRTISARAQFPLQLRLYRHIYNSIAR